MKPPIFTSLPGKEVVLTLHKSSCCLPRGWSMCMCSKFYMLYAKLSSSDIFIITVLMSSEVLLSVDTMKYFFMDVSTADV